MLESKNENALSYYQSLEYINRLNNKKTIILGFDNIVVLTILVSKLEKAKQDFARKLGMFCAMWMRIGLLFSISWLMKLTTPLFDLFYHSVSGRDLVFLIGGLRKCRSRRLTRESRSDFASPPRAK